MSDDAPRSKQPGLLVTLVSALAIVVGLQAWYMADMRQQLDELRGQSATETSDAAQAQTQAEPIAPELRPPRQQPQLPAAGSPGPRQRSPFDNDWFNQPFDTRDWDPYREMQRMQQEMDQMFNDAFGRFNRSPDFGHLFRDAPISPDIDLKDEGDRYLVIVDLPGIREGDLSVTLEEQRLTIEGAQHYEQQDEDSRGNTIFRERRSGTLRRSITLPEPVRESGMQTELGDGVLTITIPKAG